MQVQQTSDATTTPSKIVFIHIRRRSNGVPLEQGGYTLAVKPRSDGKYSVAVAQCPSNKPYTRTMGRSIAISRLSHGKFMVLTYQELEQTAQTLSDKVCDGSLQPRINLDNVPKNLDEVTAEIKELLNLQEQVA